MTSAPRSRAPLKKYGARAALYGRKINSSEHQLTFISFLRLLADGQITPEEATKAYHGDLQKLGIKPGHRLLLAGAPDGFVEEVLQPLPDDVTVLRSARPPVDVAVAFTTTWPDLRKRFASARAARTSAASPSSSPAACSPPPRRPVPCCSSRASCRASPAASS